MAHEPTAHTTEAAREALALISEHINFAVLRWVDRCVSRVRLMGVRPTATDIAFLSLEASGGLMLEGLNMSYASRQQSKLQRAQHWANVDLAPLDGTEASYKKGRDLAVWFAPSGTTALTKEQCAYGIRNEMFAELDHIVTIVMHEDSAEAHDEQTLACVDEAIDDIKERYLAPAFTRHNVDGYIRCEICAVELCYLNMVEVGARDECVLCRGWLTGTQRLRQHKTQRQAHITGTDFFRGWASPQQTYKPVAVAV